MQSALTQEREGRNTAVLSSVQGAVMQEEEDQYTHPCGFLARCKVHWGKRIIEDSHCGFELDGPLVKG